MSYNSSTDKLELYNGAADPLVNEAKAATLTNKILSGNTAVTLISGSGTLTLNTTGTATVPNATDTLVGKATTDVLTNKSIDADGTGNSLTNIANAAIKAAAAIALNKLAATTVSRALVSDGSGFVSAATTTSTEIGYVNGVTSAIQTQLDAKIAKTLTTTTGDMIYASSANTPARLAVGSANQVIKSVGGIPTWSTAPTAGINYLASNPDAETDTTGWVTYADAAGNVPVNGISGSPTITWTRTTSSPLRGTGSFLFTRGAANRQGEGVAYDFSIDRADQARALSITCDYKIVSGTFFAADGITAPLNDGTTSQNAGMSDLEMFVYDVTNSVLLPVSPQVLTSTSTIEASYKGTFQTSSNSTSYRLILHTARSTAVAFTAQFDNFYLGPQAISYGTPVTDWTSFTCTIGATTTPPTAGAIATNTAFWRRVGDSMEIVYNFAAAASAAGTGTYLFPLPSGYTADTTKQAVSTNVTNSIVGPASVADDFSGELKSLGYMVLYNSTNLAMAGLVALDATASASSTEFVSSTRFSLGNAVKYAFRALVPISGWSSSVQMSNDAPTRVVAASYYLNADTAILTNAVITWDTQEIDTLSGMSSGRYTIPVSGFYDISGVVNSASSVTYRVYKNGSFYYYAVTQAANELNSFSSSVPLVAGDIIDLRPDGDVTVKGTVSRSRISIKLASGPSAIAASEFVGARYTNGATLSILNTTDTIIQYDTKDYDTHGAVTTGASWKFTAPISGYYDIHATYMIESIAQTTSTEVQLKIYKNGLSYITAWYQQGEASSTTRLLVQGEDTLKLIAGDYISIVAYQSSGGTVSTRNDVTYQSVQIKKVG